MAANAGFCGLQLKIGRRFLLAWFRSVRYSAGSTDCGLLTPLSTVQGARMSPRMRSSCLVEPRFYTGIGFCYPFP